MSANVFRLSHFYIRTSTSCFPLKRFASTRFFELRAKCSGIFRAYERAFPCPHRLFSSSSLVSKSQSEPLRILFCGSDELSAACLEALEQERKGGKSDIESIDVLCRPEKRSDRGHKSIRKRPLIDAAQAFGLRLHEIDTFTGWDLPHFVEAPRKINLIIAVSFGLFIPPRLLNESIYGGLNVHPSLLPDLRGASPIHWTLLYGDKLTGVTLQTLHPEKFDHGIVLKQTPYPGFAIPRGSQTQAVDDAGGRDPQYAALFENIQRESQKLLVEGLRERVYVPPLKDVGWLQSTPEKGSQIRLAPKIKDKHRHIDWLTWSAENILVRQRILGSLWSLAAKSSGVARYKFTEPLLPVDKIEKPWTLKPSLAFPAGCPYVAATISMERFKSKRGQVLVNTCDGNTLRISEARAEGLPSRDPLSIFVKDQLMTETDLQVQSEVAKSTYWKLREPLQ